MKTQNSGAKLLNTNERVLETLRILASLAYRMMTKTYYAGSRLARTSERLSFLSTRSPRTTPVGILNRIVYFLIHFPMPGIFFRLLRSDSSSSEVYDSRDAI